MPTRGTTASTTASRPNHHSWVFMLSTTLCFAAVMLASMIAARAEPLVPEKDELKLGFIKLTDMAPLAIAKELGFFEEEGLYVTLEPQANWKVLLDRVISGELDGAHMLAGQPLAATIGFGTKADIVTPFSMDLNGNAVTVSNDVWALMKPNLPMADGKPVHPIKADALRPVVDKFRAEGKTFNMGMVFPVSTHNYELRYWLAAGKIHPGFYSPSDVSGQIRADVLLSVTPPPQMPATLEAGTIHGYCVGEPWNQAAVFKGIACPSSPTTKSGGTTPRRCSASPRRSRRSIPRRRSRSPRRSSAPPSGSTKTTTPTACGRSRSSPGRNTLAPMPRSSPTR